jgi:hypothetical protein
LEVKLAALPADAWEAGDGGVAEAGVIIADDEGGAVETPLLKGTQEVTPVGLSFAERGADAENGALAGGIDADRQQDGAVDHGSIAADLFITGIEDEIRVGNVVEWTLAPEFELFIELGGGAADLRGGDLRVPASSARMAETRRVETPWTYISAMARVSARSERWPRSRAEG